MKKLKTKKNAQKKRSGREVCEVGPEAGREPMVGNRQRFVKELLEARVKERGSYGW